MTLYELYIKSLCKIPPLKKMAQKRMVRNLKNIERRKRINIQYNRLNRVEKMVYHSLYAKLFNLFTPIEIDDEWTLIQNNLELKIPLRKNSLWLDWDCALSVFGNDTEVKDFYLHYVAKYKPNVFYDIGANYGTHSLIMSKLGIMTRSFEPNPSCHDFYQELMKRNHVNPILIKEALGNETGKADLLFNEKNTWNGSLVDDIQDNIRDDQSKMITVSLSTLDIQLEKSQEIPDIIKIDTEGFELNVLKGAIKTLKNHQPDVIFESILGEERSVLWQFLDSISYSIRSLSEPNTALDLNTFKTSPGTNFVASTKKQLF